MKIVDDHQFGSSKTPPVSRKPGNLRKRLGQILITALLLIVFAGIIGLWMWALWQAFWWLIGALF